MNGHQNEAFSCLIGALNSSQKVNGYGADYAGKNPFSLDSKEPNWENFHDFLLGEVRYLSVKKAYPNEAEELFAEAQKMAQIRYQAYVRKTQENWGE